MHSSRQTRRVGKIIRLFKKGEAILKRLPIFFDVAIIDTLPPQEFDVASDHIIDFLSTLHTLRCQLDIDVKRAVIPVERFITRCIQLAD